MKQSTLQLLLVIGIVMFVVPIALAASPPQQDEPVDYTALADDWLSKLSDKYLGDVLAYPAITHYTNQKFVEDSSYAIITDSNIIDVGAKLYIPTQTEAEDFFTTIQTFTDVQNEVGIGVATSLEALDPLTTTYDANREFVFGLLSDPLIELDEEGNPLPALAESWALSEDRTRLTVKLREDAIYHHDDTSEGDIFNAGHLASYWNPLAARNTGDNCLSVEAIDDYTVDILLNGVDPQELFPIISQVPIFHPNYFSDENQPLIGTGPFQIDYSAPTPSSLINNPTYWNTNLTMPPKTFYLTDDFTSLSDQLAGAIDLEFQQNYKNGPTFHGSEQVSLLGIPVDPLCTVCGPGGAGPIKDPCSPPQTPGFGGGQPGRIIIPTPTPTPTPSSGG